MDDWMIRCKKLINFILLLIYPCVLAFLIYMLYLIEKDHELMFNVLGKVDAESLLIFD
jgi:hypothetical protein